MSYTLQKSEHIETSKKGTISHAIVGGIIAGNVGAIIGSNTAKQNSIKVVDHICILIITNPEMKEHMIHIPSNQATNSDKIISMLDMIKKQANAQNITNLATSVADEIKKYKELLDIGAITIEEYEQKKKQLLNI